MGHESSKPTNSQNLSDTYQGVKPAIVAIVQRVSTNPDLPEIIGTGFVVDGENGLIMTNHHVVDAMLGLPRVRGTNDWPASILFMKETEFGMVTLYSDIKAAMSFEVGTLTEYMHGQPDVAILRTDLKNLPQVEIKSEERSAEGQEIATAGFPMGTKLLLNGRTISQLGPTLKKGIISSILPFPCPTPHALLLDTLAQGGQSGSPIFDPADGKVIGLLYAGAEEIRSTLITSPMGPHALNYSVPTNMTYAVPAHFLQAAVDSALKAPQLNTHLKGKMKDFNKLMDNARKLMKEGKRSNRTPERVSASQIEIPQMQI